MRSQTRSASSLISPSPNYVVTLSGDLWLAQGRQRWCTPPPLSHARVANLLGRCQTSEASCRPIRNERQQCPTRFALRICRVGAFSESAAPRWRARHCFAPRSAAPRSSAGHPWRAIGRCLGRRRGGVVAQRPSLAHDRGSRHQRQLSQHPADDLCGRACRKAILPPRCCWTNLPAGETVFYRVKFQDLSFPEIVERIAHRAFSQCRIARAARSPSPGRAISQARAGASTRRAAACAALPRCATIVRISSSIPATASMPIARSSARSSCRTAMCGAMSSPRTRRRWRRRSRSSAATTNTICSTAICWHSTPRCRCWRNGTITKSPMTGGRVAASRIPIIRRTAPRCWPRAAAEPFANICRCANRR